MAEVEAAQRPRTRTMTSHDSKWSHRSRRSDSLHKTDLTESPKDKMKITGKADPSKALTELQPAAEALQESTMGNLRSESFTGKDGQVIQEPDASNPTRYRWERPLQTIMSFEDDVNRTYREKVMVNRSYDRPQSFYSQADSRRSSYFGYNRGASYNGGGGGGGYYRNPYESTMTLDENAGSYNQPYGNGPGYGTPHNNNPRFSRGYTEPYGRGGGGGGYGGGYNGGPVGPPHGEYHPPYANTPYQNSRERVNSSPESDQVPGISTGHSSYGSSYGAPPTPGYDQMTSPTSPSGPSSMGFPMGGGPQKGLPQTPMILEDDEAPPVGGRPPRVPMKLNTGVDTSDGGYEKYNRRRSSWFKRRFSRDY